LPWSFDFSFVPGQIARRGDSAAIGRRYGRQARQHQAA
jgi:hypothetical protein